MNPNKIIMLLSLFVLVGVNSIQAQRAEFPNYTLEKPSKLRAGKIFFKELKNMGNLDTVDINKKVKKVLEARLHPLVSKEWAAGEGKVYNSWYQQQWFEKTNNPKDAAVQISGSYRVDAQTEVNQNLFYETASSLANPIPYFDVRPINRVNAEVIITYTYADKTKDADTLRYFDESEGRKGYKIRSLAKMVSQSMKSLNHDISSSFNYVDYHQEVYLLEKVKIKDKALKDEYKQIKDLWKEKKVFEAANLFKRIYEKEQNKEAAYNLGMCYELIGNLEQADEYYSLLPNFHTKTRMKAHWEFFNYLKEIGVEPRLIELQ
ncbi:MAG: hypothetical protein JEZ03_12370 [Bacteroidales bacterium]|nr:hypothetical protein [Bacteroidales bacterium]